MDSYTKGVGCWSLDPTQPADLGIMLLAGGFQPGWRPCWMALDMEELEQGHPFPQKLRILPDNITRSDIIKNLPHSDADLRIFSNQKRMRLAPFYKDFLE